MLRNSIGFPFAVWGATDFGYYSLDGSFSLTLDWNDNVERFSRSTNLYNFGFLGILASAVSFVLWNYACKIICVVRTTICLYLEPIIGVAFATVFLKERLTLMSIIGTVIIIAGVVVANWKKEIK